MRLTSHIQQIQTEDLWSRLEKRPSWSIWNWSGYGDHLIITADGTVCEKLKPSMLSPFRWLVHSSPEVKSRVNTVKNLTDLINKHRRDIMDNYDVPAIIWTLERFKRSLSSGTTSIDAKKITDSLQGGIDQLKGEVYKNSFDSGRRVKALDFWKGFGYNGLFGLFYPRVFGLGPFNQRILVSKKGTYQVVLAPKEGRFAKVTQFSRVWFDRIWYRYSGPINRTPFSEKVDLANALKGMLESHLELIEATGLNKNGIHDSIDRLEKKLCNGLEQKEKKELKELFTSAHETLGPRATGQSKITTAITCTGLFLEITGAKAFFDIVRGQN